MKHFLHLFLGTQDLTAFLAVFLMALLGVALSILHSVKGRSKLSTSTPIQFSWAFFWRDNLLRILLSVMHLFVALRFFNEYMGTELTFYWALVIGLSLDKVSAWVKSLTLSARK